MPRCGRNEPAAKALAQFVGGLFVLQHFCRNHAALKLASSSFQAESADLEASLRLLHQGRNLAMSGIVPP
jgi:hypothetical protein